MADGRESTGNSSGDSSDESEGPPTPKSVLPSPIVPLEYPRALFQCTNHFLQQVEERLPYERYRAFLLLLMDYLQYRKTILQVFDEGTVLLQGHPDLIEMFNEFCHNL